MKTDPFYTVFLPIVKIAGILFLLFLVIYFLSFLLRDKLIAGLIYKREFSHDGVYEGETVTMTETVINPGILPLFFLHVEAYVYNGIRIEDSEYDPRGTMQYLNSRFHLLPFMQIKRKHKVQCLKRGYYALETADAFYSKRVRYITAPCDLYVYPRVVQIDDLPMPVSNAQGECISVRRLIYDPFSVSGIRSYMFGDPFNSINFKATAKSGGIGIEGIRVNSRDYCSDRTILVYLNFQLSGEKPIPSHIYDPMMERGLSCSAALIREAFHSGYRVGFAANCMLIGGEQCIRFAVDSGEIHLKEILQKMSFARCIAGISFTSMLAEDIKNGLSDTEIFVITPELPAEAAALISQHNMMGNTVHTVMLTGEKI